MQDHIIIIRPSALLASVCCCFCILLAYTCHSYCYVYIMITGLLILYLWNIWQFSSAYIKCNQDHELFALRRNHHYYIHTICVRSYWLLHVIILRCDGHNFLLVLFCDSINRQHLKILRSADIWRTCHDKRHSFS
jgi:hypothetical protein